MINCVSGRCASVKGVKQVAIGPTGFVGCACTLVGWACNFCVLQTFLKSFFLTICFLAMKGMYWFTSKYAPSLLNNILLPFQIVVILVLF
jgi:hypothetical protein